MHVDATPLLDKTTPPLKGKSVYRDIVGTGGQISGRNQDGWQHSDAGYTCATVFLLECPVPFLLME